LSYHSEVTCDCSLSLLGHFSFQILGRDFVLGERVLLPNVSKQQGFGNHVFMEP
jgi:hypothetical protein